MHKTLLGLAAVAALAVPASAFADQAQSCDAFGHSITLTGSNTLWPPNHKYHSYTVTALGTEVPEHVMLDSMVTSSQPDLAPGSGHTINDADPAHAMNSSNTGTTSVVQSLRAERAGPIADGRTYTFDVTATWDLVNKCTATFKVVVPHDQGN